MENVTMATQTSSFFSGWRPAILVLFLMMVIVVVPVSASTLTVGSAQVNSIGNTATVDLILDSAPTGLSGYNITVDLRGTPGVGTITGVTYPSWVAVSSNTTFPSDYAYFKASALSSPPPYGSTNVRLATLTIRGLAEGSTPINVTLVKMNDFDGAKIYPAIAPGTFSVIIPPTAAFTTDMTSPTPGQTVTFTDASTGTPTSWAWDFGDGATSSVQSPTHAYTTVGTYIVKLIVTNTVGSHEATQTLTVAAGSGSGLANSAWPKVGHDLQNTGQSPYVGPQTDTIKWTFLAGGHFYNPTPVFGADGTIYVGDANKNLYALDPNGTPKWKYTTSGTTPSYSYFGSAAVGSDGTIYITPNCGRLFAITPVGSEKYRPLIAGASYPHSGPSIGTDGTIYVGTYKGLYARNPADGSAKWSNATVSYSDYATPAIASDGTLYIGSYKTNRFYAFNPDGTPKWEYLTGGKVQGSPAIGADGTIYVGSFDAKIYAFNPDGTVKWTTTTGNAIYGTPAIGADGTLYIGSTDSIFYAFNPADGTQKWTYITGGAIRGAPAIGADGTIYFADFGENKIYALNSDGSLKWTYTMGGAIHSESWGSPSIGSDGTLYVTSYDGTLYAFHDPPAPVAAFTSDVQTGTAPLNVTFTDMSTNVPTSWSWDFGDGDTTNATKQNPVHTYATAGTFTVKLTATNAGGSGSKEKAAYITVSAIAPVAAFTYAPTSDTTPLAVRFTDVSTGTPPLTWAWDFNHDGVTDSTEQSPVYTYATAGRYSVKLTVTNTAGSSMAIQNIAVSETDPVAAPEFPTMALPAVLIIGMLGTVLFIRRTKEN